MAPSDDTQAKPLRPLQLRLDRTVRIRIAPGMVHDAGLERRIGEIWAVEKARAGERLFDGAAFGLVSADAAELVLRPLRYRDIVARRRDPSLASQGLNLPHVGVSGVLTNGAGLVLGRRASHVAVHGGAWETAPSGVLAVPDPGAQVLEELREELGLGAECVAPPELCGLLATAESAELVLRLQTSLSTENILTAWRRHGTDEYDALEIVPADQLAAFCRDGARLLLPDLRATLDLAGLPHGPRGALL